MVGANGLDDLPFGKVFDYKGQAFL